MATLFDSASLALIPSGVKDGKAYSIKPTDGSGDFTFSRGTDTATRVNASGLIEKERGNLLLQSNTFNTTWSLTNTSLTSGQSGYDGSSDAWELDAVAGGSYVSQNVSISGVHTFSTYLKAGTTDYVLLLTGGAGNAFFNLSGSGAVGTTSGLIDAKIESVGGGWFRCSITQNASTSFYRLYPANSGGTSAGSIYIQDAQLEQGLVATDYIETTTAAVYEGITDNLPRLDYSGGASCPSLLLEGSRTNLFPYSEYFGGWQVFRGSLTANSTTSPEGVVNAYRYEENADTGQHFVRYQGISMTSGTDYTGSIFAKAGELTSLTLGTNALSLWNPSTTTFNLSTGEVTSGSGTIEPMGNGWYRCIISGECLSTTSSGGLEVSTSFAAGSNGDGLYIYGGQFEAGSYPTSYIPTYGTSASRAADSCVKTGISSLIGQTEGTIFLEVDAVNLDTDQRFAISDGTSANRIALRFASGSTIQLSVVIGSTTQASISGSGSAGNTYKIAGVYKENDFALWINGVEVATDTSGTISGTFSRIANDNGVSGQDFYNPIKQALLFKTRLTNAELASLTTI